jgi:RHS repeat-associated protein
MNIMIRSSAGLLLTFLWVFGPCSPTTRAQARATDALEDIGVHPFDSRLAVENGYINTTNGNLHLEFLLGSFPQRHSHKIVTYKMVYDSGFWSQLTCCAWYANYMFFSYGTNGHHTVPGWRYEVSETTGTEWNNYGPVSTCRADSMDNWDKANSFQYTEPNQTVHKFNLTTYQGFVTACGNFTSHTTSGDAFATDGSGYHVYATGVSATSVFAPDGTQVYDGNFILLAKDVNGNIYTKDASRNLIDSLGRTPVTLTVTSTTATFSVLNSKGTTSPYTLTFVPINIATNFASAGSTYTEVIDNTSQGIQSIILPDGTSYSFTYDSGTTAGHYGQITSMTLPTGGHISYTYGTYRDPLYLAPSPHNHYTRGITSRVTPDGTWTYTPQVLTYCTSTGNNNNCQQQFTVSAPNGDQSTFLSVDNNSGAWPIKAAYYNGAISASNLLATQTQTFDFSTSASPKVDETTSLLIPGGATLNRTTQYCWDLTNFAKVTKKWEWNFYSGPVLALPTSCVPASTPDRTTTMTYLSDSNPSYASKDIRDRVLNVTVTNKTGSVISNTTNCFDYAGGCGGTGLALVSNVSQHDDTNFGTANTIRGNLTQAQKLISGTSNYAVTSMTYDTTGQIASATDANGHASTFSYTDNFYNDAGDATSPVAFSPSKPTNASVKTITKGGLTSTVGYYWGTGRRALVTDPNNQTTFYHFYDSLNRPTSTRRPDLGWNFSVYPSGSETQFDSGAGITSSAMTIACPTTSSACTHNQQLSDSLGRVSSDILVSDPDGQITISTVYDVKGRVLKKSNPFRSVSDATYGWTTFTYDGLDRATQVQRPDGSVSRSYFGVSVNAGGGLTSQLCASTTYGLGYPVLRVDEAGHKRQSWSDSFGHIIEVDEPDSANTLATTTCYLYDLNDNLTAVLQNGSRQRSFSYDMLSRLVSATNPESGTITYTYDNGGNVLTKTAPAPNQVGTAAVTTNYSYDVLNRMTQKSFSDTTPTVKYGYDAASIPGCTVPPLTITNGLGRRTGMCDGGGAEAWSYNSAGLIVADQRTTNGITKGASYTYNLDGSISTLTYPSGRTVTYTSSAAARDLSAVDSVGPINYATGAKYAPSESLSVLQNGSNALSTFYYNSRLQPCRISVKYSGTAPTSCADSANIANILDFSYNYNSGLTNNGNVIAITNNRDTTRSQTFSYDPLNRLIVGETTSTFATSPSHCWGEQFSYDTWGNLNAITGASTAYNGCVQETLSVSSNNNNQVSGFCYDAAGNLLAQSQSPCPSPPYLYNAENELTMAAGVTYAYDGNRKRVQKSSGKLYWYGIGSEPLDETDLAGNTNNASFKEYVYFNGRRIARRDSSNVVYYYFADQLSSARILAGDSGTPVDDSDFYPFGGQRVISASTGNTFKFTGKERDSESGFDDFGARYYSSALGRFISADWSETPAAIPYADLSRPQSLNLNSYVLNNPINSRDANGHFCEAGCVTEVIAAVIVIAAAAWGAQQFVEHMNRGIGEANQSRIRMQEMEDAALKADSNTAEEKEDQAKEHWRKGLREAQEAGIVGIQMPGTSTGGDIGLGVGDAIGAVVNGVATEVEKRQIEKKNKEREQQQRKQEEEKKKKKAKDEGDQHPPPSPPKPVCTGTGDEKACS